MIQRIQTVYLILAALASALLFVFPLAYFYNEQEGNYRLFIYGIRCMDPEPKVFFSTFFTLPLVIFVLVSLVFSVAAIFLYRNRPRQVRLCNFNVLANIIFLMVLFFFYIARIKSLTSTEPDYHYVGMILPLVTIACLVLATRAINKDEALVKAADRLR